jgi:uncharacterized peroxidase-related enzyme
MVCWIDTVPDDTADGRLREIYAQVKSPGGRVDNVYRAQSLRPETIRGHDVLYRSVLHPADFILPAWFRETVAVYTCLLLRCEYAVCHHFANARRLLQDEQRADTVLKALREDQPQRAFGGRRLAFLRYARKLTCSPQQMRAADIEEMRTAGATDGEILEVNQICAAFNYSARVINGLGVELGSDVIGYYPQNRNEPTAIRRAAADARKR